ncbi:hypothetical protein SAMN05421764_12028 [Donghicola eburneus]|nr:hypothetical protein SAMN05421764_12028 [Donghicola eburneus]
MKDMTLGYATLTALSRRWQVDPSTARSALKCAEVSPSVFHRSPRYPWRDVLSLVEGWPDNSIGKVAVDEPLMSANYLADELNVTAQTIRNYGRSGQLHCVSLSARTLRYAFPIDAIIESEEKIVEQRKK